MIPLLDQSAPICDHLILDEAQDLPRELLAPLKHTCRFAAVFADERQSLTSRASSVADITNASEAGGARYFPNRNYRNTQEIADLAQLFYTGDPTELPARPTKAGEKPRLVKGTSLVSAPCRAHEPEGRLRNSPEAP